MRSLPLAFIVRALVAAMAVVALTRFGATRLASVLAWSDIALAVGTELPASLAYLLGRR
jgi:hypothetical protein